MANNNNKSKNNYNCQLVYDKIIVLPENYLKYCTLYQINTITGDGELNIAAFRARAKLCKR